MSSAKTKAKTKRPSSTAAAPSSGKRTASIARSIAGSLWLRRFMGFIVFDILLCIALLASFVYQCNMQLPEGSVTWGFIPQAGMSCWLEGWNDLLKGTATYVVSLGDGQVRSFPLSDSAPYAAPVLAVTTTCEIVSLITGACAAPRIRRKLRPLNDLALAAEAISSAAVASPAYVAKPPRTEPAPRRTVPSEPINDKRIKNLERAITSASVDSPQVVTGDADLRSIEVALNGLLRRMQEAKLQQMRFVSDASHELRTPIAVIQGYVNMLDRWGKTDEAVLDESIEALKTESAHMKELVEQLLFLARGDSGRTTLNRTSLSLAATVREVWEESRMIDPNHTYELQLPTDGNPCTMVGDVALVKQSMRIMVQNAVKYSAANSTITLGAQVDPATREVCYSVRDEGVGMSSQDASHAFERFWRSDDARGSSVNGTGLGLAIAKWIVDAHGGRVEVLSVENVGTRFTVHFAGTE